MTNQRKQPQGPNGQYKQVFYADNRSAPYTDTCMGLDDYLQTEVWKRIRYRRMKLDNFQCQKCFSGINIEVHHISYPEVWGLESMSDLITLCRSCHEKVHENDSKEDNQ